MAILFAAGGLAYAFPAAAVRVFIADPAVIDEGVTLLRIIAPFWAFFGGLMVVQGGFRGAAKTTVAFALSVLSRWVFRIPLAVLLAYEVTLRPLTATPVSVAGLWWGFAASSLVSFVIGALWFRRGGWEEAVIEDDTPGGPVVGAEGIESDEEPVTD